MNLLNIFSYILCGAIGAGIGVAMVLYGYSDYDTIFTTTQFGLYMPVVLYIHRKLDNDKLLQKKRTFSIDVGLLSDKRRYSKKEAQEILTKWQDNQSNMSKPYLSGKTIKVEFPYYDKGKTVIEPGLSFTGEMHAIYHKDLDDEESKVLVKELASEFGNKLDQKRIFWTFCDVTSIWLNPNYQESEL